MNDQHSAPAVYMLGKNAALTVNSLASALNDSQKAEDGVHQGLETSVFLFPILLVGFDSNQNQEFLFYYEKFVPPPESQQPG